MAHFAEIDESGVVLRVIVVADADTTNEDGYEIEAVGAQFCQNLLGGVWLKTSYNAKIRKNYAGVGYQYDAQRDAFIAPQPFASWTLTDDCQWQAPVPMPAEGPHYWDEQLQSWTKVGQA